MCFVYTPALCILASGAACAAIGPSCPGTPGDPLGQVSLVVLEDMAALHGRYLEIMKGHKFGISNSQKFVLPNEVKKFHIWHRNKGYSSHDIDLLAGFLTDQVFTRVEYTEVLFDVFQEMSWLIGINGFVNALLKVYGAYDKVFCANLEHITAMVGEACRAENLSFYDMAIILSLAVFNRSGSVSFGGRAPGNPAVPSDSRARCGITGIPRRYMGDFSKSFPELGRRYPNLGMGAILDGHISEDTVRAEVRFYQHVSRACTSLAGESVLALIFAFYSPAFQETMRHGFSKDGAPSPAEKSFSRFVGMFLDVYYNAYSSRQLMDMSVEERTRHKSGKAPWCHIVL